MATHSSECINPPLSAKVVSVAKSTCSHPRQSSDRDSATWTDAGDGARTEPAQILKAGKKLFEKSPHAVRTCKHKPIVFAEFRLKLKKVGKTTRPFRYDLKQIPYDYTAEVRNRYKGLDLIVCLMNYGQRFMTLYRRQKSRPFPRKRNTKRQNGCLRRPYK